jgi:hypothetical protein
VRSRRNIRSTFQELAQGTRSLNQRSGMLIVKLKKPTFARHKRLEPTKHR